MATKRLSTKQKRALFQRKKTVFEAVESLPSNEVRAILLCLSYLQKVLKTRVFSPKKSSVQNYPILAAFSRKHAHKKWA